MISYRVLTLFPEFFETYKKTSPHFQRGVENQTFSFESINLRDYGQGNYKKVDDTLYGGGPGLLLKPDVVVNAVRAHQKENTTVVLLDPKGEVYNQEIAKEFSKLDDILFVCGRYEGFDARIAKILNPRLISIGDYILTNGELATLVLLDSLIRLQEGTCHDDRSSEVESFSEGLLEHDQYTKPFSFEGHEVPAILLEGHHAKIEEWKKINALKNSIKIRSELLKKVNLESIDIQIFRRAIKELWDEDECW